MHPHRKSSWPRAVAIAALLGLLCSGCLERNPVFSPQDGQPGADRGAGDQQIITQPDSAPRPCNTGEVRFELTIDPALSGWLCTNFCSYWLSIRDAMGRSYRLPHVMDCMPMCSDCRPLPCPGAACGFSPVPATGLSQIWHGGYVVTDICGAGIGCYAPRCAAPGYYIARMCTYRSKTAGSCYPSLDERCVDVPFQLRADKSTLVRGTITP